MAVRYVATAAGRAHYKPLDDPACLTPEAAAKGEEMRKRFTEDDWRLFNVYVQLECEEGGATVLDVFNANRAAGIPCNDVVESVGELISKGFVTCADSSARRRPQPSSAPARSQSREPD